MAFAVRDEADILQSKLDFHISRGFSHFHIIDHGSVDGSREIIEDYAYAGYATVKTKSRASAATSAWLDELLDSARQRNPDAWMLLSDTDEFLDIPGGEISAYINSSTELEIPRHNVFLDQSSRNWHEEGGISRYRNAIVDAPSRHFIYNALKAGTEPEAVWNSIERPIQFYNLKNLGKVLFPLNIADGLTPGAHRIKRKQSNARANTTPQQQGTRQHKTLTRLRALFSRRTRTRQDDARHDCVDTTRHNLRIFHLVFRSLPMLEKRVENYAKLFRDNPELPAHWGAENRYLVHMAERGKLEQVWESHILPAEAGVSPYPDITVERIAGSDGVTPLDINPD